MQGNWTVCVPLKYLLLIQEAKCFEFTVQIPPPPDLFLYTPLISCCVSSDFKITEIFKKI